MIDYSYEIISVIDPTPEEAVDLHEQVSGTEWAHETIKKIKVKTAHGEINIMGFASYLLNEKNPLEQMPTLTATVVQHINSKLGITTPEEEDDEF